MLIVHKSKKKKKNEYVILFLIMQFRIYAYFHLNIKQYLNKLQTAHAIHIPYIYEYEIFRRKTKKVQFIQTTCLLDLYRERVIQTNKILLKKNK